MTAKPLIPSTRAVAAAETIRRGIGGKYDREHARALQAFAAFERDLLDEVKARIEGLKRAVSDCDGEVRRHATLVKNAAINEALAAIPTSSDGGENAE